MLNSQILEVAIGLIFIYLLFSLICSMVNEWFARVFLKLRASTLLDGIHSLINDPTIIYNLYRHPLINALAKQGQPALEPTHNLSHLSLEELKNRLQLRTQPSYIPGRTFALALIDLLAPAPAAAPAAPSVPPAAPPVSPAAPAPPGMENLVRIRDTISRLPDDQYEWIKQAVLPLLNAAPNLEKAYKNIENWFDDAMVRVTGWYKRKTQWITIVLAILVCFVMNVDTFIIANSLYRDSALRASVVAAAEKAVKNPPAGVEKNQGKGTETKPPAAAAAPLTPTKTETSPTQAAAAIQPGGDKKPRPADTGNIGEAIAQVQKLNLPIGWVSESQVENDPRLFGNWDFGGFLLKMLGLLFSAMAVSLGAPFWFDLLNKLVNLRGTGKPPAPAAQKP